MRRLLIALALIALTLCAYACSSPTETVGVTTPSSPPAETTPATPAPTPAPAEPGAWDIDSRGVPQFVTANYIDPGSIQRIAKFRSGIGHDYSDSVESCRSMKHYFQPHSSLNWATLTIMSPVDGRITDAFAEWAGTQIKIEPSGYPAFRVILFHVTAFPGISVGATVSAGQPLGTHVGNQTMSDVAVSVVTPQGFRLISFFDAMSDAAFAAYRARGVANRTDLVINRSTRDSQPLACSGETFATSGAVENWVELR